MKNRFIFFLLCTMLTATWILAQPRSISNIRVAPHDTIQSENAIAIHPLDNTKLITDWNDFGSGTWAKQKFAFSGNAATNFSERNAISPPPSPLDGYTYSFDPSVSFDRNGNIYAGYIASNQANVLGFTTVAKSTNNGVTWAPVKVSSENTQQDKSWLTVDNTTGSYSGRVYVAWTDFTSGSKIKLSYSTNGGTSFNTPSVLDTKTTTANTYTWSINAGEDANSFDYVQGAMPTVSANGNLYVTWANINNKETYNAAKIRYAKSTNGGGTFTISDGPLYTHRKQQIENWKIPSFPSIASGQVEGEEIVCIAYVDVVSSSNFSMRSKFIVSYDGGASFSTPITLPTVGTYHHVMPTVAINEQGKIAVAFAYIDNQDLEHFVDVYYTESTDAGSSFSTPVRVSSQSSIVDEFYYTDYMQMVTSSDGHFYAAWTDNRSHKPNTYVGDINFGPTAPTNVAATAVSYHPKVQWNRNSESEVTNYKVYRNSAYIATVNQTSPGVNPYYTDNDVTWNGINSGTIQYSYHVKAIGQNNYVSPQSSEITITTYQNQQDENRITIVQKPEKYTLDQNSPNPFNPSTIIRYEIPEEGYVTLTVFDQLGREVKELYSGYRVPGAYEATFNAGDLSSGLYYYKLQSGNFVAVKKMLLMK